MVKADMKIRIARDARVVAIGESHTEKTEEFGRFFRQIGNRSLEHFGPGCVVQLDEVEALALIGRKRP